MQKKRYILKPFTIVVGMNKGYELMKVEKQMEPTQKMIRQDPKEMKNEMKSV